MAHIHVERIIAAPQERVFAWLLDPANLTVSPVFRRAIWATDSSGPAVGATREVSGFGFWAHEQITAYDAPRTYTLPARAGGKVIELVTLPLIRSLTFRAILAGCAKALEG